MPRGVYERNAPKVGPRREPPPLTPEVPPRAVHIPGPPNGMGLSHWSPADALGWCCVICHRAFVRPSLSARWTML